jgi:hypothetical protein
LLLWVQGTKDIGVGCEERQRFSPSLRFQTSLNTGTGQRTVRGARITCRTLASTPASTPRGLMARKDELPNSQAASLVLSPPRSAKRACLPTRCMPVLRCLAGCSGFSLRKHYIDDERPSSSTTQSQASLAIPSVAYPSSHRFLRWLPSIQASEHRGTPLISSR